VSQQTEEKLVRRALSRRRFLRRATASTAGLLGGGAWLSAFGERNWPRVHRITLAPAGLPPGLEGFTLCQISDLHRGPLVTEAFLRRAVALAASTRPDMIVVTGDYVTDSTRYAASCASALAPLRARYGVFGVLGNHDYWTEDVQEVADAVTGAGVRMLTNASAKIPVPGADWWLCGLDDAWAGKPALDGTLQDVPEGAFKILLCHEPDYADHAATRGIPLQLSGHSHGGQVILPGGEPLITPRLGRKYPIGLRQVAGTATQVYTNVGLGVISIPIRLNCAPEVTLITLAKAPAHEARGEREPGLEARR
jgi:predicted MPP superfamily phosphohydrolase